MDQKGSLARSLTDAGWLVNMQLIMQALWRLTPSQTLGKRDRTNRFEGDELALIEVRVTNKAYRVWNPSLAEDRSFRLLGQGQPTIAVDSIKGRQQCRLLASYTKAENTASV